MIYRGLKNYIVLITFLHLIFFAKSGKDEKREVLTEDENLCIKESDKGCRNLTIHGQGFQNAAAKLRCAIIPKKPLDCGFPGITKDECESEHGCCFKQTTTLVSLCFIDTFQVEYYCNFTKGLCHWQNDNTGDMKWERHQGIITSQGDFSPPGDHTSGASGWFLYLNPTKVNGIARIKSEMIGSTSMSCFQFWYHMYGPNIGTLSIYIKPKVKTSQSMKKYWSKKGTAGPKWHHGRVQMALNTAFQVHKDRTK